MSHVLTLAALLSQRGHASQEFRLERPSIWTPPVRTGLTLLCIFAGWSAYIFVRSKRCMDIEHVKRSFTASDEPPRLVSVRILGRSLDISEKTIWDWIYRSRKEVTLDPIPYYKVGALVRFKVEDIRGWLERRKVRPVRLNDSPP
ncbi:MAG: helix-turn-helix domain-containing protein [Bryobacteraceae bacterium]